MKIVTLALLVRNGRVPLGEKRGGPEIGEGKLNAPGGKQEEGESIEECLARETREEFHVDIDLASAEKVAILYCYANEQPYMKVHVYRVTKWTGEPRATESMKTPEWYPLSRLPLERMHQADRHWFEKAARGNTFRALIRYETPGEGFQSIEFHPF